MEKTKSEKAQEITESLKSRIISILWDDSPYKYNNAHILIPWIQEEAEYAIKKLDLPKEEEQNFLIKVERIIGEYLEEH